MRVGNRSWDEWIAQYSAGHQDAVNRACHTFGIPLVVISLLSIPLWAIHFNIWKVSAILFCAGWTLQFVGHAFEGTPPEFIKDPRFLLVGLRWWVAKMRGRA